MQHRIHQIDKKFIMYSAILTYIESSIGLIGFYLKLHFHRMIWIIIIGTPEKSKFVNLLQIKNSKKQFFKT